MMAMAPWRWPGLKTGLWAMLLVAGLMLAGYVLCSTCALVPVFAQGWSELQFGLGLWRAALFLILIGFWPWWVERLARYRDWSPAHRVFVFAQRWRVAAWLVVLELVLVQNVLTRFIEAILR